MEATLSILAIVVAIALWVAWFSFKFINFKTPFFHKNAAPAVQPLAASQAAKSAFTLLEVLVVVIIIGILSGLAYSSFMDIVFSNRAKETAQAMRTFAERSLAEAKRQNTTVKLELVGNDMVATIGGKEIRQPLSSGFSLDISFGSPVTFVGDSWENKVTSVLLIGVSGITEEGYFVACGARGYCGAAVKTKSKNSFTAYVRRGKPSWEEL